MSPLGDGRRRSRTRPGTVSKRPVERDDSRPAPVLELEGAGVQGAAPAAERVGSPMLDLLVARIGRELFALPVDGVDEIVDVADLRPLDEQDPALLGVATIRDRLLPVYRTDQVLGAVPGTPVDLVLILAQVDGRRIGIAVDDAEEVIAVDRGAVRAAAARGVDPRLVRGVVLHEGRLLTLLDSETLAARFAAAVTTES